MKVKYILIAFLLILNTTVWAQLYCINYDVKDGLPTENITAIGEDANGYMYIGTAMGLSYFDGVSFQSISDNGSGDIPNNVFVEEIRFDSLGNLWMSTERSGLFRLEVQSNSWIKFSVDAKLDHQIPDNTIWDLEVIDGKVVIACENNGVSMIDIITLEISKYDSFQSTTIVDINVENDGDILLATKASLYCIESFIDAGRIDTLYNSDWLIDFVSAYSLSDGTTYLISYTRGVFQVKDGALIEVIQPDGIDSWRFDFIAEYNGKQWLTLKNTGIASIAIHDHKWQVYESHPYNKNTLLKGKYNVGFKDSRSILWIGTSKGLTSIVPELQVFRNIDNEVPTNEFMLEAYYDKSRSQYVMLYASEKNKVKFFDEQFEETVAYNHTPDLDYIQSLWNLIPYEGNYFCLGFDIMQIDGVTGKVSKAKFARLPNVIKPRGIMLDESNNLWIVHDGDQVVKYSLERDEIVVELSLPNLGDGTNYRVRNINDCGKYISIAASDVFLLLDKETYQTYVYDVDLSSRGISKIDKHPDKRGSVIKVLNYDNSYFICSRDEGVYKASYSLEDNEFTVSSSLSPSELYGPVDLKMDDQSDIWIATDNGLVLTDQQLKIKKRINSQNGLPYTKLSQGLSITNGKIILNNGNGITVANINLLKQNNTLWPVDIKNVLANGESLDLQDKEVELAYNRNAIQVNVAMPFYGNRFNYKYSYRLLPMTSNWNEVKVSQSEFRFDNLQSGEYVFEIKSKLGDSESEVSRFSFIVNPPFWKAWWFLLLFSLLLFFVVVWAYKARVRNKVNQEKVKTKLAELQNEAIRAQLNPHFIFNALNSIRSLILMDRKEGSLDYLGKFSTLVREVLSISKEEIISLSRELKFNENYVNIEQLRFSQSLNYEVIVLDEIDVNEVKVPPMIMQPFIENAIWHGLLGKEEDANLTVIIKKESESLIISIDDNGEGRKKKEKKVQSSYKTKKSYGELLSKQRLQSMGKGAEIKIVDKVSKGLASGTTVIIKLPFRL